MESWWRSSRNFILKLCDTGRMTPGKTLCAAVDIVPCDKHQLHKHIRSQNNATHR